MLSRHGIGATLWSVAADEGQKQLSHAFDLRAALLPASGLDGQGQRGHLSPTHADTRQMRNGGRSSILTSLGLATPLTIGPALLFCPGAVGGGVGSTFSVLQLVRRMITLPICCRQSGVEYKGVQVSSTHNST